MRGASARAGNSRKSCTAWLAAIVAAAAPLFASAQAPGSLESDLKYGREYLAAGNPSGAATYFRQAVSLHPGNAEANLLLAVALQRSGRKEEARPFWKKAIQLEPTLVQRPEVQQFAQAMGPAPAAQPLIPGGAPAPVRAPAGGPTANAPAAPRAGGDPNQIGTPAYFTRYAQHHLASGAYSSAVNYARQALAVDRNYAPAQKILAQASGKADKNAHPPGSCEAKFSACWSGAMTYTPGSGYAADNMRRQQCMVERNICQGSR